jgi:hexaprenyl-diphosphate synthase
LTHCQAVECIQATSGVERTQLLAEEYAEKAREALDLVPESETKFALDALIDVVVERT